jgi:glutathione synthase/RimK-type ligase-like ATP-grasp enzyme
VRAAGWDEAILKPSISGGSFRTHRFAADDARVLQAELDGITRTSGALLQPFLPEVASEGEWSLVFFDGEPSHAVVKTPKAADFRVQTQYGATFRAVAPPPSLWATAQAILGRLPAAPLYARIDGVRRGDDFLLMEVEVIEPYLFMPQAPDAPARFVRVLADAATAAAAARKR